jgi:hypothetical protein
MGTKLGTRGLAITGTGTKNGCLFLPSLLK